MPAGYIYLGSYATVQVTGPSSSVDVLRITASTIPSQVSFTFNAPYRGLVGIDIKGHAPTAAEAQAVADRFAAPIAEGIERMMGSGQVIAAGPAEDVDQSNLLIDYIDATVFFEGVNPRQTGFSAVVRIPTNAFDEPSFYDALVGHQVNAAYEALVALAEA